MFFATDHHWTPDAGFWAFGRIAESLSRLYGIEVDEQVLDPEQYRREVYEKIFLGSIGHRTGKYFAGIDDMVLLCPTFESDMYMSVPSRGIERRGTYNEVIFQKEHLETEHYNGSAYLAYIGADYDNSMYRNQKAKSDKKILIIKDSFSLMVIPYFALSFQAVDILDLRDYTKETLIEYIQATAPDVVVFLYNPGALEPDIKIMFDFGV